MHYSINIKFSNKINSLTNFAIQFKTPIKIQNLFIFITSLLVMAACHLVSILQIFVYLNYENLKIIYLLFSPRIEIPLNIDHNNNKLINIWRNRWIETQLSWAIKIDLEYFCWYLLGGSFWWVEHTSKRFYLVSWLFCRELSTRCVLWLKLNKYFV